MDNKVKRKDQLADKPPALPTDMKDVKSDQVATGAMPPKKVMGAWLFIASLLMLMVALFLYKPAGELNELDELIFRKKVQAGEVQSAELVRESNGVMYFSGKLKGDKAELYKVNTVDPASMQSFLLEHQIQCPIKNKNNFMGRILIEILPVILILGVLYFFIMRQVKSSSMGAMNFGKSRAKRMNEDKKKFTFKDVAGIKEAKEEVQEIVEFLKDPKRFQKLGGRIPKGVLLMGAPGTGKTLLAKSIAGEAGVPFFSISGSDFIEMFVGVGASRVRDMFDQGKKHAPCLIFIDEIDAVGRSRFSGMGGGHDEREQTLNAMLVEMDGFETNEGVIIIAATNRPDVLDPALLRPGRFDRQVVIDLPTLAGREEILRMHAQKISLAPDADLARVARGTTGFSGADLANLLNEAALIAARDGKEGVEHIDLEEARDKVLWGRERRSRIMDDKDLKGTAWHESGHALLQVLCEHAHPLHKVTIIPRGQALGATMILPDRDVTNRSKLEFLDDLVVLMGGRIAEEKFTGDISTGARMDIKMASEIARKMICSYGMSENFGFQSFGENEETFFMGRELTKNQSYSEETARKIDAEMERLLRNAFKRAGNMIEANKDKLEKLVEVLLENETIDGRDVEDLIKLGYMRSAEEHAAEEAEKGDQSALDSTDKEQPTAEESAAAPDLASVEKLPKTADLGAQDDDDDDEVPRKEPNTPSDPSDAVS